MEGSLCFLDPSCSAEGFVLPVAEYDQSDGDCSVIGGMVYRGQAFASMSGVYFYGDLCSGIIRGLIPSGISFQGTVLLDTELVISTFGEDEGGELYVADYANGDIYRIVAASRQEARPPAPR